MPSSWQYTLPASDFVISAKGLCGTRCRSGCPIKSPFALPAAASDAQKRPHREDCKSGEARSSIPGRLAREWRFVAGVNIYTIDQILLGWTWTGFLRCTLLSFSGRLATEHEEVKGLQLQIFIYTNRQIVQIQFVYFMKACS